MTKFSITRLKHCIVFDAFGDAPSDGIDGLLEKTIIPASKISKVKLDTVSKTVTIYTGDEHVLKIASGSHENDEIESVYKSIHGLYFEIMANAQHL